MNGEDTPRSAGKAHITSGFGRSRISCVRVDHERLACLHASRAQETVEVDQCWDLLKMDAFIFMPNRSVGGTVVFCRIGSPHPDLSVPSLLGRATDRLCEQLLLWPALAKVSIGSST